MKNFICIVISALVIFGCAKRGNPSGGPIDSIPQVLDNESPKIN